MTITATNVEALRRGWEDAISSVGAHIDELPTLLETRLSEAVRDHRVDERTLLLIVDEAARLAAHQLTPGESSQLARRMQQAVYEFLLSLDAIAEPRVDDEGSVRTASAAGKVLIGAEEVAMLTPAPLPEHTETDTARPAEHALAEETTSIAAEASADVQPVVEEAAEAEPEELAQPELEQVAEADVAEADVAEAPTHTSADTPVEAPRRRFTLFRRSGPSGAMDAATTVPAEPSSEAPAPPVAHHVSEQPTPPVPAFEHPPAAFQAPPAEPPPAPPPYIAPKDGFYIKDPTVAAGASEQPAPALSAPPIITRSAEPLPDEQPASRGWRIRSRRSGKHGQQDAAASLEFDDDLDDDLEPEAPPLRDSRFETDPEILDARRQINDRLRHRRCDEAASLLQRLANELGGRDVAELALDAGDRCRALGKANAALSCYLAASRADPVHETPLLRLADICLDDKDIDLAVSYLERVARLHRLRGDRKGSLRVYRKIATVAPYRDDILNMLMHVQATGRFEDE